VISGGLETLFKAINGIPRKNKKLISQMEHYRDIKSKFY